MELFVLLLQRIWIRWAHWYLQLRGWRPLHDPGPWGAWVLLVFFFLVSGKIGSRIWDVRAFIAGKSCLVMNPIDMSNNPIFLFALEATVNTYIKQPVVFQPGHTDFCSMICVNVFFQLASFVFAQTTLSFLHDFIILFVQLRCQVLKICFCQFDWTSWHLCMKLNDKHFCDVFKA